MGPPITAIPMPFPVDVLFYIVNLCSAYGLSVEEIAIGNVEKLLKRYPNGFSKEDSIRRVDVNE
jgi:hypothetical protein